MLSVKDKFICLKTAEQVNAFPKGQTYKPFTREHGLLLPLLYLVAFKGDHNVNGRMECRYGNELLCSCSTVLWHTVCMKQMPWVGRFIQLAVEHNINYSQLNTCSKQGKVGSIFIYYLILMTTYKADSIIMHIVQIHKLRFRKDEQLTYSHAAVVEESSFEPRQSNFKALALNIITYCLLWLEMGLGSIVVT